MSDRTTTTALTGFLINGSDFHDMVIFDHRSPIHRAGASPEVQMETVRRFTLVAAALLIDCSAEPANARYLQPISMVIGLQYDVPRSNSIQYQHGLIWPVDAPPAVLTLGEGVAPSFDCAQATLTVAKMICQSAELAALERTYSNYWSVAAPYDRLGEIRKKIRRLLAARVRCGNSTECVRDNLIEALDLLAIYLKAAGVEVPTYAELKAATSTRGTQRGRTVDDQKLGSEEKIWHEAKPSEDEERRLAISQAQARKAEAEAQRAEAEAAKARAESELVSEARLKAQEQAKAEREVQGSQP